MGKQSHVVVIPHAAQGHVAPLMKLAIQIAAHGVKVTFVNTEFIHQKVMSSLPKDNNVDDEGQSLITLASIPDGLEAGNDRQDFVKLTESMLRVMPGHLRNLIENINRSNAVDPITCVVADIMAGWALEVAKEMGIKAAAVLLSSPATMALALHVPQLVQAGVVDTHGTLLKQGSIKLSEGMPEWNSSDFTWTSNDPVMQKLMFAYVSTASQRFGLADQVLSNSFYELDPPSMELMPKIMPIGPFLATNQYETIAGNFWPEDSTCLTWLDKQTPNSVIYVALGSTTMLTQQQVNELALGLELTRHPFLWVVRSNLTTDPSSTAQFPDGFIDRVGDRGKIVEWAPQEKVLAHKSIACFVSHCGWNSTLEGLSMGTPFLCWPYFADQFHNRNYVCDVWKIGLALAAKDDYGNGIITRHEISAKIKTLLSSHEIRANALQWKEVARKSVSEGGSSFKNFQSFIQHL